MNPAAEKSKEKILAIIPAFNEAQRIGPVITESLQFLPLLVVDDGSVDATIQIAKECGADVLEQHPNQGKGAALKAGFRHALDSGFDAVVTLDADGQHDPAEIPKFLRKYEDAEADLIIGARDFSQMPPVRRIANWLGKHSLSWAMGETILDNQSGYRLISKKLFRDLASIEEAGFEFEVEMIVTCVSQGFTLEWVDIRTIYAGESSHINPITHLINYIRLILKTRRMVQEVKRLTS